MIAHIESNISVPGHRASLVRAVTWGPWLPPPCGSTIFNVWVPNWQDEVPEVSHGVLSMAGVNVSDLEGANITSTNIPLSHLALPNTREAGKCSIGVCQDVRGMAQR